MVGILYGWKKEYLLEEMSLGQIILYLNEGIRFKYPRPEKKAGSLIGASAEEIRRQRDKLRKQYGQNIEGL